VAEQATERGLQGSVLDGGLPGPRLTAHRRREKADLFQLWGCQLRALPRTGMAKC
jgi:hypothetical protein